MTFRRLDIPPSWLCRDKDTRADLDRIRRLLEQLNRQMAALEAPVSDGTPSGPAGGDLDGTYPDPTVPELGALRSNFWAYPDDPDPLNYEADSEVLPSDRFAMWENNGGVFTPGVATEDHISFLNNPPAAGTCRVQAHRDQRRSWILFQPAAGGPGWLYAQPITIPSGGFTVRSRVFTSLRHASPANEEGSFALAIYLDNAGTPNAAHFLLLELETDASALNIQLQHASGGATTTVTSAFDLADGVGQDIEFNFVQYMVGSNAIWIPWVRSGSISYRFADINMGSSSIRSGVTAHFGWYVFSNQPTSASISGADYQRYGEFAGWLP